MTIIPDKEYLEATKFMAFGSSYKKWQKDFSGYVLYHTLSGDFANGWKLAKGEVVKTVKQGSASDIHLQLKSATSCTDYYWIQWYQDCTSYYTNGEYNSTTCGSPYSEWTYLYTECYDDGSDSGGDGGYTPPSPPPPPEPFTCTTCPICGGCLDGGLKSASTNPNCPASYTCPAIPAPDKPITSIADYLDCVVPYMPATITIYVDQPVANSSDTYSILNSTAGHSFIGISQNGNNSFFGFYPEDSAIKTAANKIGASILGDDSNEGYDVSITKDVTPQELQNVLSYIKNYPNTYNLDNFNCTDFALHIGNSCGMNLPDTYGGWPNGGGSNPGNLGQDIRNMSLAPGMTRNTSGGTSPSNVKNCF